MDLFNLLRGRRGSRDLSLDALIKALSSKASANKIYDPEWAPEGGWDAWCAWAYELAAAEGDEAATRDGEVDVQVLGRALPEAHLQLRAAAEEAGHRKGFSSQLLNRSQCPWNSKDLAS